MAYLSKSIIFDADNTLGTPRDKRIHTDNRHRRANTMRMRK